LNKFLLALADYRWWKDRVDDIFVLVVMVGLVVAIRTCVPVGATPAHAHTQEIIACTNNLVVKQAKLLSEDALPNGLYVERYDTNADGKTDIVALSTILSAKWIAPDKVEITHAAHPTFYLVDKDYDEEPDAVYVDKGAGGHCDDIVLYKDLRKPQTPNDSEIIPERDNHDARS